MKKIIFFSFFFILFFSQIFAAQSTLSPNQIGCNNTISEYYFLNADKIKIKKIEIDVNNYKSWTVNNIKILTTRSRFIPN